VSKQGFYSAVLYCDDRPKCKLKTYKAQYIIKQINIPVELPPQPSALYHVLFHVKVFLIV